MAGDRPARPRPTQHRPPAARDGLFQVPPGLHWGGLLVEKLRPLFIELGDLETTLLAGRLKAVAIDRPVYVAGLARAGSTVLLELIAAHAGVVTHRYRDYPPVFTPYAWNKLVDLAPARADAAVERTHLDGIMVTPDSPEAFEEVLWMAFFPRLHDPDAGQVLDAGTDNPRFAAFYRQHIRKLLLARGGARYAAKGNYNVTRLGYLQKLLPDARFVVPVRAPAAHIASLMKQHRLFADGQAQSPRMLDHLNRVGHMEFGRGRRPINTGDRAAARRIAELWEAGREAEGWAHLWADVYGHVADRLAGDAALRAAALVVRFEDLCADPATQVAMVQDHCGLEDAAVRADYAARLRAPDYYRADFTDEEQAAIARITGPVAARFGYQPAG
jgi:hypothetical protein